MAIIGQNWWENAQAQSYQTSLKTAGDIWNSNVDKAAQGDTTAAQAIINAAQGIKPLTKSFWDSTGLSGIALATAQQDAIPSGSIVNNQPDADRGNRAAPYASLTASQAIAQAKSDKAVMAANKGFGGYFSGLAFLAAVTGAGIGLSGALAAAPEAGSAASFTNGITLADTSAADSLTLAPTAGAGSSLGADVSLAASPGITLPQSFVDSFASGLGASAGSSVTNVLNTARDYVNKASTAYKAVTIINSLTGQTKPLTQGQSVPPGWFVQSTPTGALPQDTTQPTQQGATMNTTNAPVVPTPVSDNTLLWTLGSIAALAGFYYLKVH